MSDTIRVLIADDHPLTRRGLAQVIESDPGLRVVGEACNGEEAIEGIRKLGVHVAILDIDMPKADGFEVVRRLAKSGVQAPVIFLTMHSGSDLFYSALDLGVKGYVLKDGAVTEIVKAIQAVALGQHYVSSSLTGYLVHRRERKEELRRSQPGLDLLTPGERKILSAVAGNKSSKEIADELHIHYRTVENHRTNICRKLGLQGPNALLKFAFENKGRF